MELHCIRHGITKELLSGRFQGNSDAELAPDEIERIKAVRFDASGYEAVYCSPLGRCVQTAAHLSFEDPTYDQRIEERGLGIFQGLTQEECRARYPGEFTAFQELDADFQVPGGESRSQQLARVLSWLEDVSHLGLVLAVTHGGVVDLLYRIATAGVLHGGTRLFAGDNLSMSQFDVDWPDIRLLDFNIPLETAALHAGQKGIQ